MKSEFRNEMLLKLGGEEVLLRPSFENIEAMESCIGSVSYFGNIFARVAKVAKEKGPDEAIRVMPSMTEMAKVIYYNQAATNPDDPTKKKFSLEEIWELCSKEGMGFITQVQVYLSRIVAGAREMETAPPKAEVKNG